MNERQVKADLVHRLITSRPNNGRMIRQFNRQRSRKWMFTADRLFHPAVQDDELDDDLVVRSAALAAFISGQAIAF